MIVARTRAELAAARAGLPEPVGAVFTMGGLHDGHTALLRAARRECASVVATLFVNPTQFESEQDAATYPRDEAADLRRFAAEAVDVAFAPPVHEVYAPGSAAQVGAGRLGRMLEGASRPGHFDGVAAVVARLLDLTRPERTYLGQKDWQQTRVIRQVVKDLALAVDVRVVGTVRDDAGLALGTRNVRLSIEGREAARVIHRALAAGADAWRRGERRADRLERTMRRELEAEPCVTVDYAVARNPLTLDDLSPQAKTGALLVAAWIEGVRLIDNFVLGDGLVDIDPGRCWPTPWLRPAAVRPRRDGRDRRSARGHGWHRGARRSRQVDPGPRAHRHRPGSSRRREGPRHDYRPGIRLAHPAQRTLGEPGGRSGA